MHQRRTRSGWLWRDTADSSTVPVTATPAWMNTTAFGRDGLARAGSSKPGKAAAQRRDHEQVERRRPRARRRSAHHAEQQ